ncbi:hypothetical protein PILCRDRAFT_743351 [Piloderma croceum F 1598]|uniref:Uncharacterized protein n=1 Tax=Piloderma croceum (strain F 1598) TaxID=765440 RepID=A0A0C3EI08_PILCF|nr:hypothetical protein PILCRDRAFT_743351 [Piloderma croceum F 1598]
MNTLATGSFDGISTHISMADSAGMTDTSTDVRLLWVLIYNRFCQHVVISSCPSTGPVLGPHCASNVSAVRLFEPCEVLRTSLETYCATALACELYVLFK